MSDTRAFNSDAFKNVRVFVCGSAPLTAATWQAFREHTGHPILERYGMSESILQRFFEKPNLRVTTFFSACQRFQSLRAVEAYSGNRWRRCAGYRRKFLSSKHSFYY